jgi:hypothetical protein
MHRDRASVIQFFGGPHVPKPTSNDAAAPADQHLGTQHAI